MLDVLLDSLLDAWQGQKTSARGHFAKAFRTHCTAPSPEILTVLRIFGATPTWRAIGERPTATEKAQEKAYFQVLGQSILSGIQRALCFNAIGMRLQITSSMIPEASSWPTN